MKLPHKLAGSAFVLFVIAVALALYPAWQAQAAGLTVSGVQGGATVTIDNIVLGEIISLCATGGPTACPAAPTPTPNGGSGTFNAVNPSCGALLTSGVQNFVSFTATCTGTVTFTFQCITQGPITIFMQSNSGTTSRPLTCGTGGGSSAPPAAGEGSICVAGNCVGLTANPNVVSCKGGSTTVTAFAHYQLPQVVPATPLATSPNGLPMAQQPYFFFTVTKGIALIQQTSNNTAVVTLLEGVPEAEITATTGGIANTIRVVPYCRPGTAGVAGSPTAGGTPGAAAGTPVPTPAPIGSLVITASPPSLQTCDGSLFIAATVKDSNGKLVPDGTNVLFIATRGILDPASANTNLGTANVVYTAVEKASGTITLSAQAGSAFGSVQVPVTCGTGGAASGSATSGGLGAANGSPTFRPPSTGQGSDMAQVRIRPPSTGEAGLKVTSGAASAGLLEILVLGTNGEPSSHSSVLVAACADQTVGEVRP